MKAALGAVAVLCACGPGSVLDSSEEASSVQYGVDYAWSHPSISSIVNDGFHFVARYYSYDSTKDLSKAEAGALIAAKLNIMGTWEDGSTNALNGKNQGISDARQAVAEADGVGEPSTRPIFFAVDFDATPGDQTAINAYFDGVASVIGQSRTGAYGDYYVIQRLFNAGKIAYGWQTYAWSGGQWESRAQVRQVLNGIFGGIADRDEAVASDFGQWGNFQSGCGGTPAAPAKPSACGVLNAGEGLTLGGSLKSCDGRFELTLKSDGNLALYSGSVELWNSGSWNQGGYELLLKPDGNLAVLSDTNCALWQTSTWGNTGASLALQDDGNLVLSSGSTILWNSNTGNIPPSPTACGVVASGQGLAPGQSIKACNGYHELTMQSDGNLVLYNLITHKAIWAANSTGTPFRYLNMHVDGNLSVQQQGGSTIWSTQTQTDPGAFLEVKSDGNLALYSGGAVVWQTSTWGQ